MHTTCITMAVWLLFDTRTAVVRLSESHCLYHKNFLAIFATFPLALLLRTNGGATIVVQWEIRNNMKQQYFNCEIDVSIVQF